MTNIQRELILLGISYNLPTTIIAEEIGVSIEEVEEIYV